MIFFVTGEINLPAVFLQTRNQRSKNKNKNKNKLIFTDVFLLV